MDFWVINCGNTFTEFAFCENGKLGEVEKVATAAFLSGAALVPPMPEAPLAVATVVPEVKKVLADYPCEVFYIDSENTSKIINYSLMNNHTTIGMDRIANVVSLVRLGATPGLVVDCGTAITFEGLDAERHFKGGAIIPGRKLMRKSLNIGTKQLPEIALSESLRTSLGLDTATSIEYGIDNTLIGGVVRIIELIKKERNFDCQVYAVGGDRKIFLDNIPDLIDGGDNFTLEGIKFAYEFHRGVKNG
ncbi:MAG: type III pantothenate kinase [Lentisphaeria bacterium]|nr:type III pantothenate kinase [Lentisphaeria bacterium]